MAESVSFLNTHNKIAFINGGEGFQKKHKPKWYGMNSINEILDEVAAATSLNNGEIVVRAIENMGITCLKCNYPNNARMFIELLYEYTRFKITAYRFNKRSFESYESNLFNETTSLIKRIWPCEDCMKLFNPTGRIKLGPKIYPQTRGVLDYV